MWCQVCICLCVHLFPVLLCVSLVTCVLYLAFLPCLLLCDLVQLCFPAVSSSLNDPLVCLLPQSLFFSYQSLCSCSRLVPVSVPDPVFLTLVFFPVWVFFFLILYVYLLHSTSIKGLLFIYSCPAFGASLIPNTPLGQPPQTLTFSCATIPRVHRDWAKKKKKNLIRLTM